jgi:hypothetical protein
MLGRESVVVPKQDGPIQEIYADETSYYTYLPLLRTWIRLHKSVIFNFRRIFVDTMEESPF